MSKPLPITYELAMAAGRDAATANMRADGRTAWNDEDYGIACATFNRLMAPSAPPPARWVRLG